MYRVDSMKIACEITGLKKAHTLQFIQENLSEYASSIPKGTEIISEVFADISTGNPTNFSREFYSILLKLVGGVKK